MEKSCEIMQIGTESSVHDILFLICAMSEIRPILQKAGLAPRHGLAIFLEDQADADFLTGSFLEAGATICKSFSKPVKNICNNGLGIHTFFRYDKEDKIMDFLEAEDFLPIVITHGAIPDLLKNGPAILPFRKKDIEDLQTYKILDDIETFKKYTRKNPSEIAKKLYLFKTSEVFLQYKGQDPLYLSLMAVTDIWGELYRYTHNEPETEQMKDHLRDRIKHFCSLSEDYKDGWDILDVVRDSIFAYVDSEPWILIDEINKIQGPLLEAVETNSAILYDAEYYYFPEKILRKACEPLLQALSFPEIKLELKNGGFLYCNSTTTRNYTVKKLLTNAYGYTFRVRFYKLLKNFFVSLDSLALEERRNDPPCLSEISTENAAQ